MDTVRASNKGYFAEVFVVTFNHAKGTVDDDSKIKIMLVSSQQMSLHVFPYRKQHSAPIQLALASLIILCIQNQACFASFILFSLPHLGVVVG